MSLMRVVVAILFLLSAATLSAQKLKVKIIDRQDNQTEYTYIVPGHSYSHSNMNANCFGGDSNVNCSGSASTNGTNIPAHEISYRVRGATLALLLPDGRTAVVNCESKFAEHFAGPAGNRRSCRVPLGDSIQANFHGDKAKLIWPVSLDGRKKRSETYKILSVLGKPDAHKASLRH